MTIKASKCLVLGAGGFIGTNLCIGLEAAGAHVEGFGRLPHRRASAMTWHDGDFEDAASVATAVRGQDFVFHLLGGSTPSLSNAQPASDISQSLLPSVRLMEACRESGVRRLIFASSGGTVYGPTSAEPIKETAPTEPITAYGINKLAVEKYLALYRHLHGLDSIVLRIANPYGPFQHARRSQGLIGVLLSNALSGKPIDIWNDGSNVRDFIHIDDVVRALVLAAEYDGTHRVFNVGSGTGRSLREVIDAICRITALDPAHITYSASRSSDVPVNVLDIALMMSETGWRPQVEWMTGLENTARWLGVEQRAPA